MRFFKYLIFLLLTSFSFSSFAAFLATGNGYPDRTVTGATEQDACYAYYDKYLKPAIHGPRSGMKSIGLGCYISGTSYATLTQTSDQCWYPDYKIVTQSIKGQIKKSICLPINGVMCKYTGNLTNVPVVNGSITTTFSSVSKTPDPGCKEDLLNPPCDPKDPYGGCYTPPNQECTRQFDGSIVCPDKKEPPIEKGCNGADYCKRPPQGCGLGYVSGTYNGERI